MDKPRLIQETSDLNRIATAIESIAEHLAELTRRLSSPQTDAERLLLNEREENILEAVGTEKLTGEALATLAGYEYGSNFKSALAALRRRGFLDNKSPGYVATELGKKALGLCQDSRDKGLD